MNFIEKVSLAALVVLLGACAGKPLLDRPVPKEIRLDEVPTEFKDKFEVQETKSETVGEKKPEEIEKKQKTTKKEKTKKKTQAPAPAGFQYPSRRPEKDPVWVGEKQVLEVTFLGMPAGTFTMDVLPYKEISGRKVYHYRGRAQTSRLFSVFYTLDDVIESFMDYDGLFSHRFQLIFNESSQTRNSLELYDSEKKQTFYHNQVNHKDNGYSEDKLLESMEPFPQDMISFLYYLRMVPLPASGEVRFPMVSEGKNFEAVVEVVRKDYVDSPLGRVRAIVVRPETKFKDRFEKKGENYIWLSDDDRRFILMVDFKVKIGSIKARAIEIERGRAPSSS